MNTTRILSALTLVLGCTVTAMADEPSSKPSGETLRYEVVQVEGKVRVGPETDEALNTNAPGWFSPKVGDRLGGGIQIRVPLRSKIKLVAMPADPPTVLLIESASTISISELAYKDGAAKSRIKLGYGAIRAGVSEGGTRSDMEIEAPSATLSKRGTDIFRFEYHDGRFMMSLTEQGRGMLQAIQNQSGYQNGQLSRFVTAGQFVTQQLMRAIDNVQFDRQINVNDQFGLSGNDKLFTLINDHGLGFLLPAGLKPINIIDGNRDGNQPLGDPQNINNQTNQNNPLTQLVRPTPIVPGGDFGIGQGRLPIIRDTLQKRLNSGAEMGRLFFKRDRGTR